MTSKERLLAAMRGEEVDYPPCSIYFNEQMPADGYNMLDWREHIRLQADLGVDPIAYLVIPGAYHPEVQTRTWLEEIRGERFPVLFKEYQTPAGALRHGVFRTPGFPPRHEGVPGRNWDLLRHAADYTPQWSSELDIPWDDTASSNLYEPLIKGPEDVDAFEHIWRPPTEPDLDQLSEHHQATLETARDRQIAVQGYAGAGLATYVFVMGVQNMAMFSVDHPKAFRRLAEIDSRTNIERIKLCARAGCDYVKRFGAYEQANLIHPKVFREVVAPLLREEVKTAHEAGLPIYYRVVTGMEMLLDDIAQIGFDCIQGGEPRLSHCSFEMWRDAIRGRASSWTGVSTPVLLAGDDPDGVREEVRCCMEVFGKRGFLLGVTNSIRGNCRWENIHAMIEEWKRLR